MVCRCHFLSKDIPLMNKYIDEHQLSGTMVMKQERLQGGRARTDMNGGSGRGGKVTDTQGGEEHKKMRWGCTFAMTKYGAAGACCEILLALVWLSSA